MARFQIHKVTALPSPLEAHAIYLVTSGTDYVEIYVTGASASTVRRHINEADVQSLIDAAVGGLGAMDIVDDIAEREVDPLGDLDKLGSLIKRPLQEREKATLPASSQVSSDD